MIDDFALAYILATLFIKSDSTPHNFDNEIKSKLSTSFFKISNPSVCCFIYSSLYKFSLIIVYIMAFNKAKS